VGRLSGLPFERDGAPPTKPVATSIRIEARCVSCASPARVEFDAVSPGTAYELNAGVAEAVVAKATFPVEGLWRFDPVGGELRVRSPTSTESPVVVVRPWSVPLPANCGPRQIGDVVARFARAFNSDIPTDLALSLNPFVDFSMTGEPLKKFVSQKLDDVGDYARARFVAGETIHAYLVYAASTTADNAVDLAVYFVRKTPDLPSSSGYRRAFAGSRLSCDDLLLLRFNADLLPD